MKRKELAREQAKERIQHHLDEIDFYLGAARYSLNTGDYPDVLRPIRSVSGKCVSIVAELQQFLPGE